jgi:integrase
VQAKVIDQNPLAGYRRQRATRADRLAKEQHGRALTDEELVAVWTAAKADTVFGRFARFLILTGCRRGEGAGLSWQMVNRKQGLIVLPSTLTKSGRNHTVVITPSLAAVLDACVPDARSSFVFPSHRTGGIMSGWNRMTAALVKSSKVQFSPHDLRRTFRTGLSRLGIETEAAELAIGHARGNLIEIYNRDKGLVMLRRAFEAWADHVDELLAAAAKRSIEAETQDVFS